VDKERDRVVFITRKAFHKLQKSTFVFVLFYERLLQDNHKSIYMEINSNLQGHIRK